MSIRDWNAKQLDRYRKRLAEGHHDRDCEQRERYCLCGCRERKRLAEGRTKPPILLYQAPMCDGCGNEVYTDVGDGWECETCHVTWGMNDFDEPGRWDDENGDLSASTDYYGERLIVLATKDGAS